MIGASLSDGGNNNAWSRSQPMKFCTTQKSSRPNRTTPLRATPSARTSSAPASRLPASVEEGADIACKQIGHLHRW